MALTAVKTLVLLVGVERLAGMTLKDHEMIDASQTQGENIKSHSNVSKEDQSDADIHHPEFSLPEKLKQHFVMVPCKLRLVTLAAFILWKCKVWNLTFLLLGRWFSYLFYSFKNGFCLTRLVPDNFFAWHHIVGFNEYCAWKFHGWL